MQHKVSMDTVLTGLLAVMLLILLFYDPLRRFHPALDPLLMLSGQAIGLVFLALMVFCIIGMVLLVGGQFLSGQKITKEHIACVSGLVPR